VKRAMGKASEHFTCQHPASSSYHPLLGVAVPRDSNPDSVLRVSIEEVSYVHLARTVFRHFRMNKVRGTVL
jgi:hypothetical protein